MASHKFPWLRFIVHSLGVLPLAVIGFAALTSQLSANPIQDIEQRLGRAALYFLVASLAVTPVYTLTGWRSVLPRRRALGLYVFLYASLHFLTFAVIDYGFNLPELSRLLLEKTFIILGLITGLILLPLAITSFDFFPRTMGKTWNSLHRLVYLAGITAIIHYAWAKKGDFFTLQGDILKPFLWGMLVLVLFILRIPVISKKVSGFRKSLSGSRLSTRSISK